MRHHSFGGVTWDHHAVAWLPYRCSNCGLIRLGRRATLLDGWPCSER